MIHVTTALQTNLLVSKTVMYSAYGIYFYITELLVNTFTRNTYTETALRFVLKFKGLVGIEFAIIYLTFSQVWWHKNV